MSNGGFFAIGSKEFEAACDLGLNQAVSFLVMARGTGRDNSTTKWSALAVFNRTGMARRRAKDAIDTLIGAGLVEVIKEGKHPQYKLHKPDDDALLWLPNELVDGAGAEAPPITKLREAGNLDLLKKFIQLYGIQDLDSDGGLPRDIAWVPFEREVICPVGHFNLYGFNALAAKARSSNAILVEYHGREDDDGNAGAWIILSPLLEMGLLEKAFYMAESAEPDAELIYPVNQVTAGAMDDLCCWLDGRGGDGFAYKFQNFDLQGIAIKHIKNASMVGLYRLRYRPKTGKTSRWLALDMERTEAMSVLVHQMIGHEKAPVVHIKALKGL